MTNTALVEALERLKAWLSYFAKLQDHMYVGVADDIAEAAARIAALEAEVERLKPFVSHFAMQPCACGVIPGLTVECSPCAARAALEPKP